MEDDGTVAVGVGVAVDVDAAVDAAVAGEDGEEDGRGREARRCRSIEKPSCAWLGLGMRLGLGLG